MADGLTITVASWDQMNATIRGLDISMKAAIAGVLYEHMLFVMAQAKELCPYDEGDLAGSGRVNKARVTSEGISITLDFGVEPHLDYAVDQHENLVYHHSGGKQAKFLETPLMEWTSSGGPERVLRTAAKFFGNPS